jgi:hypothetical protein
MTIGVMAIGNVKLCRENQNRKSVDTAGEQITYVSFFVLRDLSRILYQPNFSAQEFRHSFALCSW